MRSQVAVAGAVFAALLAISQPAFGESVSALMNQGIQSSLQGNNEQAAAIFKEIIGREPGNFYAYNNLGMVYGKIGKTDLALESYQEALRINPDFPMTLNNISQIYKDRGNYELAASSLEKAVRIFPEMEIAQGNLGEIYFLQRRYDEAIVCLEKAVELRPDNPQFHLALAKTYQAKNMETEARKEFDLYDRFKKNP